LAALFAKQGRVNRFKSKAERDAFLESDIASVESYQTTQTSALEATRVELGTARKSLEEVEERILGVHGTIDDGRKRVRELGEHLLELKDEQNDLMERRKELWREDTKLGSLVSHASDEKKSAENNLASMMDKVCFFNICLGTANMELGDRTRAWVCVLLIASLNDTAWMAFMVLCTVSSRSQIKNSASQLN
jgi:predicted nuclease with TOPRIM domain